jgi:hypothetical protein
MLVKLTHAGKKIKLTSDTLMFVFADVSIWPTFGPIAEARF